MACCRVHCSFRTVCSGAQHDAAPVQVWRPHGVDVDVEKDALKLQIAAQVRDGGASETYQY